MLQRREDLFTKHPLSISSINKYLLDTCFGASLVLNAGAIMVYQTNKVPSPMELMAYRWRLMCTFRELQYRVVSLRDGVHARCVLSTNNNGSRMSS